MKLKGPAGEPAVLSGEGTAHRQQHTQGCPAPAFCRCFTGRNSVLPHGTSPRTREQKERKEPGEEGGSTRKPALPHKPRRIHRAREARGPRPEWVCWVAGSDRIKVTQVHGDPAG